jgi:hypothetical protein
MKKYLIIFAVVSNFLVLFSTVVESSPLTLDWQDLVPKKGMGEPILVPSDQQIFGLPDRKTFDGDDDDYAFLVESLETLKYQQPPGAYIKPELDGKLVRIPGYITPLSFNDAKLREFLLVPYHGACIHLPPPPGNQIVYIKKAKGIVEERLYQPVWITGTLRSKSIGTAVADVGYSIEDAVAEPYDGVKEQ